MARKRLLACRERLDDTHGVPVTRDGTSAASPPAPAQRVSLWAVIRRYWWVVVLIVVVSAASALAYANWLPERYTATAGLIVEDPRASDLFEVIELGRPSTQSSERYLADQVEILRSTEVANVASTLMDGQFSPRDILRQRDVAGDLTSNLIEVGFEADTPEAAKAGADAVAEAYQEVRRDQVKSTAAVALAKVDALLASVDLELADTSARIDAATEADEDLQELRTQIQEAQVALNRLIQERRLYEVDSLERLAINAQIDELSRDFVAWEVLLRVIQQDDQIAALQGERDAALAERATLVDQRNAIEVDAELAAAGVTLYSPAPLPTEPSGLSTGMILAVAVALGLVLSASVAYYLGLRLEAASSGRTAGSILNAPHLAEIPHFDLEGITVLNPVTQAPSSASAEAFRFAASMIDIRSSTDNIRSLLVIAAGAGVGRTTFVANVGLAAAAEGIRTLLVDADFGKQDLTNLLSGSSPAIGITDVIDGVASVGEAATRISVSGDRTLSLLSQGSQSIVAASYLRSNESKEFFAGLRDEFDLILVDGPPLLQVAYASTLARYTDAVLVVVEYAGDLEVLEEVRDHLELIEAPVLGFVHTGAPLRQTVDDTRSRVPVETAEPQREEPAEIQPSRAAWSPGSRRRKNERRG